MDKSRNCMGSIYLADTRDSQYHLLSGQMSNMPNALDFGPVCQISEQESAFLIHRKNYPYVSPFSYSPPLPEPAFTLVFIISDALIKKGFLW